MGRLFKNKRAIELSINFIVMLVLAIAVFIGGLVFATKFFKHAESVRTSLDSETERQLEALLDSGSPVVLPIGSAQIFRKKHDAFGLGVFAKYEGKYLVKITDRKFIDKDKVTHTDNILFEPQLGSLESSKNEKLLTLDKNEKSKVLVLVQVPAEAESGTYIFEFTVDGIGLIIDQSDPTKKTDKRPYDAPVQMIINVP